MFLFTCKKIKIKNKNIKKNPLPPGENPIAVNKYYYYIILDRQHCAIEFNTNFDIITAFVVQHALLQSIHITFLLH